MKKIVYLISFPQNVLSIPERMHQVFSTTPHCRRVQGLEKKAVLPICAELFFIYPIFPAVSYDLHFRQIVLYFIDVCLRILLGNTKEKRKTWQK